MREKFNDTHLFLKAARYYEEFLGMYDNTYLKSYPGIKQESENVLYIFKKCYELRFWDEVIALWNPLESLLFATKQQGKMRYLFQVVKTQKTGINIFQKSLIIFFCLGIVYLACLDFLHLKTTFWNYIWNLWIGFIPFGGGIVALFIAKSWGMYKTQIGRAVLFISLGLISWGVGNIIWTYYNLFQNISVPYPSLADLGYLPSYFLWTIGVINLPHALGGKLYFSNRYGKILLMFIPLCVLALSYFLIVSIMKTGFIFSSSGSPLKLFFDIAYPAGDVVILTCALVIGISFKFFGGKYKLSMYTILLGFCFMYVADFLFSYSTTVNIYYNGSPLDIFFFIALSLLTFGILGFYIPSETKD